MITDELLKKTIDRPWGGRRHTWSESHEQSAKYLQECLECNPDTLEWTVLEGPAGEDGPIIAFIGNGPNRLTNLELIVRAVNSFEAARDALIGNVDLFEAWRDGIFKNLGVTWQKEPPAVLAARAALKLMEADA